ncbi:BtpA/SgcQ family protein [Synechococcus sp. CS-1324]|nr:MULTISPECIES: BtpA/SgcQ family protein [unclassified Synechococcus]MCT0212198.1 BtpA/SgcQ family protein [Synechococcus sp. CS-1326]MCT0230463.1 BtpA/SgcQ family protein [Synechococcus sp. CS-1324]MCT0233395.1 BtpA/SgcQ family protein [Synechococcus sp. CS-1327]PZV03351.1 MAG: phosphorybosylanthranilate isomerase [Cyanobium sp.]
MHNRDTPPSGFLIPDRWQGLFAQPCPLIGVIHLRPLPGSPGWQGDFGAVLAAALADVRAYRDGGADGLIVENFGDVPFWGGTVPPETVAAMTRLATELVAETCLPVGINVLRNDALAALAIAQVSGARFLRVNVLSGATVTDQGVIEGQAAELLRRRRLLGAESILILADVLVKHGAPLAPLGMAEAVADVLQRGGADGVIVSGAGTGQPTVRRDLEQAMAAARGAPVLIGSGATPALMGQLASCCNGVIAGTALKQDGVVSGAVDRQRVTALRRVLPQSPNWQHPP